jgi:tetratricopeptide (TPR) repeat protein
MIESREAVFIVSFVSLVDFVRTRLSLKFSQLVRELSHIVHQMTVDTLPVAALRGANTTTRFPACKIFIVLLLLLLPWLSAGAQSPAVVKRLEQAATLIREHKLTEAERQLHSILKETPAEAQAVNLLGTVRASQGRLAEAESLFGRAIGIDKQLISARLNLAYLYLLKGAPEKTIVELQAALRLAPANTEALYRLARLLLSQNRIDDCVSLLEQAKQTQSLAGPFFSLLGDAYLRKGDAAKAEESYLLALGKADDAVEALSGMAQIAHAKGDAKTASAYLSRAKEGLGQSAEWHYRFALTALKLGSYGEAKWALEQAVQLNPGEAAYFVALGAVWLKKPDLFAAEQAFRKALQLHTGSPQGHMYLGYTLLKQKRYAEARAHLEKSLKTDMGIPEPLYYTGLLAQEQNEDGRAVEIFERVVRQFPGFANAHVALGASYLKLKNYPRAQQELELAVKLNPDEPKAHYHLAQLYARLKDPQRAQQEMQLVEKLKEKNRQATDGDLIPPPVPNPF